MLPILISGHEFYNESTGEFIDVKDTLLKLEHSLVSVSKWEEHYKKPFLTEDAKTKEETIFYIKCMTINNNVNELVYELFTAEQIESINRYIQDNRTATWFTERDNESGVNREQITSELIYYWMIIYNIPQEYQKWHLSRLMALIRICNIKNSPNKKMSEQETLDYYRRIKDQRRAARLKK